MKKIVCFGDSNTWGFDPRLGSSNRYPADARWTGILNASPDYAVRNYGINGAVIPKEEWAFRSLSSELGANPDAAYLTMMFGTNDILTSGNPAAEEIAARMEQCLIRFLPIREARAPQAEFIFLSPPKIRLNGGFFELSASLASEKLSFLYHELAKKYGLRYADAAGWELPLAYDGIHLAEEGHRVFAEKILGILKEADEA